MAPGEHHYRQTTGTIPFTYLSTTHPSIPSIHLKNGWSLLSRHWTSVVEACEVPRGPELCFCLFLFGKTVDRMFSLSLLWTLPLRTHRSGCLWPWRVAWASPSPEALCSLSVVKPCEFTLYKGELGLEAGGSAVGSWLSVWGEDSWGWRSPLFQDHPSVVRTTLAWCLSLSTCVA